MDSSQEKEDAVEDVATVEGWQPIYLAERTPVRLQVLVQDHAGKGEEKHAHTGGGTVACPVRYQANQHCTKDASNIEEC